MMWPRLGVVGRHRALASHMVEQLLFTQVRGSRLGTRGGEGCLRRYAQESAPYYNGAYLVRRSPGAPITCGAQPMRCGTAPVPILHEAICQLSKT